MLFWSVIQAITNIGTALQYSIQATHKLLMLENTNYTDTHQTVKI